MIYPVDSVIHSLNNWGQAADQLITAAETIQLLINLCTGSGRRGLDLESQVKFPYIHESRNFFFRFHESRV